MSKFAKWRELQKQVRDLETIYAQSYQAITRYVYTDFDKTCVGIKQITFFDLLSLDYEGQYLKTEYCDNFNDKPCIKFDCPMCKLNHEHIETEKRLQKLKHVRNKAFWNIFVRSK